MGQMIWEPKMHHTAGAALMHYVSASAEFFNSQSLEESLGSWGQGRTHIQVDETVIRGVKQQNRRGRKRRSAQWLADVDLDSTIV